MSNRKRIGLIIVVMLLVICSIIASITVIGHAKSNKYEESVNLGIKYVQEGMYEEAILAFEKAININDKNPEAEEYIMLINTYKKLEQAYGSNDFNKVQELIESINGMKNSDLFYDKVSNITQDTENKVAIMGEIDGIEVRINELIANNDFDEAINILNDYLGKDLTEDYRQKVNVLIYKVTSAKEVYEDEKKRLEEEKKRLEEEAKKKKNEYISKLQRLERDIDNVYQSKFNELSNYDRFVGSKDMYNKWDEMINEIWGVLQNTLPNNEMKSLTEKQMKWIEEKIDIEKSWDDIANKPAEMRPDINFVLTSRYNSLADMTKQRCYELVNNYMK